MEPSDQPKSTLGGTKEVSDPVALMWGLLVVSLVLFLVGLALRREGGVVAAVCWTVAEIFFGISLAWLVIRSSVASAIRSTHPPRSTSSVSEPEPEPEPDPAKSARAEAARGIVAEMRAQGHSRAHIEEVLEERGFTRADVWDVLDQ